MLAGKVRLKNFMIGVGTVVGIGCGATVFLLAGAMDSCTRSTTQLEGPVVLNQPPPSPMPVASPTPVPTRRQTYVDVALAFQGRDLGADKLKDAVPGPYKINAYQDAGSASVNRLKIDLDRDEKWDEKWTFEPGVVTREIAPDDDEVYAKTLRWNGVSWEGEGEAAEPAAPDEAHTAAKGRPVDTIAMAYRGRDIKSDKLKDASKSTPFKVNVYQDAGHATANRVKLDLDRDDKWDEKWTFDGDDVLREVAPADDEVYTETYGWDGSGWVSR
ncbi:MAG: hypothetical protein H6737_28565 [Alphaproteobacteria bacterium]|nr:hypothetical protein [Alphaproteobacteria bacterium]